MASRYHSYHTQFDPGEKELVMALDAYSCHKERTGVCSLDIPDSDIPEENTSDMASYGTPEYSREYCRELYKSCLEHGIENEVHVSKNNCGHYDIIDGQHRLCIAKQKGLVAPARMTEGADQCNVCLRLKYSLRLRIKARFVKNLRVDRYFIQK